MNCTITIIRAKIATDNDPADWTTICSIRHPFLVMSESKRASNSHPHGAMIEISFKENFGNNQLQNLINWTLNKPGKISRKQQAFITIPPRWL